MLLDATTKSLKSLQAATGTPVPQYVVSYRDIDQNGDETWGQTEIVGNGEDPPLEVTICAAPGEVTTRIIESVYCHNADNAQVTVSIFIDDGTTNWIVGYWVLETLETAVYARGKGWTVHATDGAQKNDT